MSQEQLKVGPFTWQRDDHGADECWDLVLPEGVKITHWAVKNYGGAPNDSHGFSGWRLVSGGPFTSAGGWTNREDAMRGVIPFLLVCFKQESDRLFAEADRLKSALTQWLAEIDKENAA